MDYGLEKSSTPGT